MFDVGTDTWYGKLSETESGIYTLDGLGYNGYFLFESAAPEGFQKDDRYFYFTLNADVSCGKHFADRYAGFHRLAETLTAVTEEDYLHRFHNIRNLTSDLMKAIDDDDDDYVLLAGSLLTMDEFLRQAIAGKSYYIGNICKYHR